MFHIGAVFIFIRKVFFAKVQKKITVPVLSFQFRRISFHRKRKPGNFRTFWRIMTIINSVCNAENRNFPGSKNSGKSVRSLVIRRIKKFRSVIGRNSRKDGVFRSKKKRLYPYPVHRVHKPVPRKLRIVIRFVNVAEFVMISRTGVMYRYKTRCFFKISRLHKRRIARSNGSRCILTVNYIRQVFGRNGSAV